MDEDTIFPAVSLGEEVLGKYRDSTFCAQLKTIIILTNFRVLIRWRSTECPCLTRSHYSSINLDSIHRIDDTPSNSSSLAILFLSFVFENGIAALFMGSTIYFFGRIFTIYGIVLLIISIIGFIYFFIVHNRKHIHLKGTFGSIMVRFPKDIARAFEAHLSELIYRRKMKHTSQQIGHLQQTCVIRMASASSPYYGFVQPTTNIPT